MLEETTTVPVVPTKVVASTDLAKQVEKELLIPDPDAAKAAKTLASASE